MQIAEKDIIHKEVLKSGWIAIIYMENGEKCIRIFNPTETNEEKFFAIDTINGKHGAPMLEKEPSLRFPVEVNGEIYEIAGIIILDENGEIKDRFSLSNLKFIKKQEFDIRKHNGSPEFFIDGKSQGFLNTIYNIDKNRVIGNEAVFTPQAPNEIKIHELETLGQIVAINNK